MARYIDVDDLLTDEMLHTIPFGSGRASGRVIIFVDEIEKLSTADVVPKSEVEELEAECERQYEQAKADILANMADGGTSCHWCINEHKAQAKAEAAREIFEEIESLLYLNQLQGDIFIGKYFDADLENDIAELKKKYTEDGV